DILHQNALPQHTWKNPVSSYDLPKCFPILSIQPIKPVDADIQHVNKFPGQANGDPKRILQLQMSTIK
ncbi:hypothetical protein HGM15179_003196, partial [Zosterops borbonicus]